MQAQQLPRPVFRRWSACFPARPLCRSSAVRVAAQQQGQRASVTFRMARPLQYGTHLAIVGGAPHLGNWNARNGAQMVWSEGNVWTSPEIDLPRSTETEYKYVVRTKAGELVEWQQGPNLRIRPPGKAEALLVKDSWDQRSSPVVTVTRQEGTVPPPQAAPPAAAAPTRLPTPTRAASPSPTAAAAAATAAAQPTGGVRDSSPPASEQTGKDSSPAGSSPPPVPTRDLNAITRSFLEQKRAANRAQGLGDMYNRWSSPESSPAGSVSGGRDSDGDGAVSRSAAPNSPAATPYPQGSPQGPPGKGATGSVDDAVAAAVASARTNGFHMPSRAGSPPAASANGNGRVPPAGTVTTPSSNGNGAVGPGRPSTYSNSAVALDSRAHAKLAPRVAPGANGSSASRTLVNPSAGGNGAKAPAGLPGSALAGGATGPGQAWRSSRSKPVIVPRERTAQPKAGKLAGRSMLELRADLRRRGMDGSGGYWQLVQRLLAIGYEW